MDRLQRNQKVSFYEFCKKNFEFIFFIWGKSFCQVAFFWSLFLFLNCQYLQQRRDDLSDIFSIEVSDNTYGVSVRASFLQLGALYQSKNHKTYGVRNGIVGILDQEQFSLLFLGSENFNGRKIGNAELEQKIQDSKLKDIQLKEEEKKEIIEYLIKKEKYLKENQKLITRNKIYQVYLPIGLTKSLKKADRMILKKSSNLAPISFYTNVNFTLGMFYGISINFNPGEVIDFVFGIFTFDIFKDDEK